MTRAAVAAAVAAAIIAPGVAGASVHVFPDGVPVAVTRECDAPLVIPGTPLEVRVSVLNGTAAPLRGVVYAEHVPAVYHVETLGVSIDGAPLADYLYEVSAHDIYPDTDVHRWVIEEPGRYEEQANPVPAGGELVITYRMSGAWYYTSAWPPFLAAWERESPAGEYGFAWPDETLTINADDDDDGMADAYEIAFFSDLSHDGTADGDGDGLDDLGEYRAGSRPDAPDTDADGLDDGAEVLTHGTSPVLADTDGDGLVDGAEVLTYGTSPFYTDTDADALTDYEEAVEIGTDPVLADTDSDGVGDRDEVMYDGAPSYAPYDPVAAPSGTDLDARDPDSDHDGYSDYLEMFHGSDPISGAGIPAPVRISFQGAGASVAAGFCPAGPDAFTARGFGWR